jgi:Domain of unknown function (DUF6379)
MFRERMIVDDSLVADESGYSIRARMPWYRGLPLSSVVELTVAVDGRTAPPQAITIETDGVERPLAEAAQVWDQSWYVLDDLIVRVADIRLEDRDEHEIGLAIGLRIPYLPLNGEPVTVTERYSKTMPAKEPAA